jgi:amidase
VLSPTTPVTPFPWTRSYPETVEGREQDNYYRWLALTYVVTLTTHPAISLPCGLDGQGMPFGLQAVGPFRGDLQLLGAAQALESAFARQPLLARPRPDVARLQAADPPLRSIVTAAPDAKRRVARGPASAV